MTAFYTSEICDGHVTPPGHPERVDRLVAVRAALDGLAGLERREAPEGRVDDILRELERRKRSREHDRLHLSATHGGKHVDLGSQRRTSGDEAQCILTDLI